MKLDNALNLQAEVFRKVFAYEETPAAFSAGSSRFGTPTFVEPDGELLPELENDFEVMTHSDTSKRSVTAPPRPTRAPATMLHRRARDIALGVGLKGADTREHELVVVYQDRKLKNNRLLAQINDAASGEARFTYVGRARALMRGPWHRAQVVDPLRIGSSLAHFKVSAGTLGCFVAKRGSGARGVLSNNHVLANVNRGAAGDEVRQPGRSDGGKSNNRVASLHGFVPIETGNEVNTLDCAWAVVDDSGRALNLNEIFDSAGILINQIAANRPVDAWPDIEVVKVGRTTGYTQGNIDAINVNNLTVSYGRNRKARFDGQIQIESLSKSPFARPGDSGSLILDRNFEPVGLLFSGSSTGGFENVGYTWANPIGDVLEALDLEILIE